MKKLFLIILTFLSLILVPAALIQSMNGQGLQQVEVNPDCTFFFSQSLTAGTSGSLAYPGPNGFDNRINGCQTWVLQYTLTVASGTFTSVTLQAASGAAAPGSFAAWGGTVSTGVNPLTAVTGTATFSTGCASSSACTIADSWVRVIVARGSVVGSISGVVYGWKQGSGGTSSGGGGGGGGCVGTQATPCVTYPSCPNSVPISVSASGLTTLLGPSGTTTITVCHISFGFASGVNFNLVSGGGGTCSAGTGNVTGVYQAVQGIALDVPFKLPSGFGLCANLGSAVAGGGLLVYAQQ